MKRSQIILSILLVLALLLIVAPVAFAYDPNPSPSGATHGAFNVRNQVYGTSGTPGGVSDSLNSSAYGTGGGSPGAHDGAVGQVPGATGFNNSAGAPWGHQNQ